MSNNITTPDKNGSFHSLIAESGEKLGWATPKAPLSFRFRWEKVQFSGKLSKIDEQHRLLLLGDMGPLPFSAENPDFRERLIKLVSWKPAERIKFVLEPEHQRIYMMIDDILNGEISGTGLLASAVKSLFHARPFIELAKEIGWEHPADEPRLNPNMISLAEIEPDRKLTD